jgi:dihydrofolate synthase/folylpolyglutamate synthase
MTDLSEYQAVIDALAKRWPEANVLPELDRERLLMDLMGDPYTNYPIIHIAGTNGKSSTAFMVDALLRAAGLRTGRFTSPDLNLLERFTLFGATVTPDQFVAAYREVAPYADFVDEKSTVPLTRFEILTAMAYAMFADAPVDAAVVEVGMGGAWDCTNVADGLVSVITPVALDHQNYLGDTLAEIADQKAGIIKPGSTVICAAQTDDVLGPILEHCQGARATLALEGREFGVIGRGLAVGGQVLTLQGLGGVYEGVFLPLHGVHQAQNAALALAAAEAFLGARQLDPDVVREAFAGVASPGRLERIRTAPTILLDAAHNPHGMAATVRALTEEFAFSRLIAVVAAFADKDVAGMLELLEPNIDAIVCTRNSSPRALSAEELAAIALEFFDEERVAVSPTLPDAIETAVTLAEVDLEGELAAVGVLITGSVVTVADARHLLRG